MYVILIVYFCMAVPTINYHRHESFVKHLITVIQHLKEPT